MRYFVDVLFQPKCIEAQRKGTSLNRARTDSNLMKKIVAKEIFVHFIKGKVICCGVNKQYKALGTSSEKVEQKDLDCSESFFFELQNPLKRTAYETS